jgi:hypothetical protein
MNKNSKNSKPMMDINSAWEAEIKKTLDALWENRFRLSLTNVELLRRLSNKTRL